VKIDVHPFSGNKNQRLLFLLPPSLYHRFTFGLSSILVRLNTVSCPSDVRLEIEQQSDNKRTTIEQQTDNRGL
jgi:hypothetical protein